MSKRTNLSIFAGIFGIICNLILCIFKFIAGNMSGSVSITADAANNLSDAGSNIVSIAGTLLSRKPVDKEHPFGHGRAEYISAMIIAVFILMMSFELGKSSVERIISPQNMNFSLAYVLILFLSIIIKFLMFFINGTLYRKTGNINLKAVQKDSLNDCIATGAVLISLFICKISGIHRIDGIIGLFVTFFVAFSGINVLKNISSSLLGQPPSKKLVDDMKRIMLSQENIIGVHDIIVHDYGPNRIMATAHAECPSDVDVETLHDSVDKAEKQIELELNISMCIHIDPVKLHDEETERYKLLTEQIIKNYNKDYSFHDFKFENKNGEINLIFELVIPFSEKKSHQEISNNIQNLFYQKSEKINTFITIEHTFI